MGKLEVDQSQARLLTKVTSRKKKVLFLCLQLRLVVSSKNLAGTYPKYTTLKALIDESFLLQNMKECSYLVKSEIS
jgi:hypothetical protein